VSHVNFDRLREFDKLFENRREIFVVATLAVSGPLRFSELAYQVQQHVQAKVHDSTITRILGRLEHRGMITIVVDHDHDAYALTESGDAVATVISAITHSLDRCKCDEDQHGTKSH